MHQKPDVGSQVEVPGKRGEDFRLGTVFRVWGCRCVVMVAGGPTQWFTVGEVAAAPRPDEILEMCLPFRAAKEKRGEIMNTVQIRKTTRRLSGRRLLGGGNQD